MLTKTVCPRYDEMKACWRSEPDSRPTFPVLGERMSELLCSGVRNQYLQLSSIIYGGVYKHQHHQL